MQVCTPVAWLALSTGVQGGGGVQEIILCLRYYTKFVISLGLT